MPIRLAQNPANMYDQTALGWPVSAGNVGLDKVDSERYVEAQHPPEDTKRVLAGELHSDVKVSRGLTLAKLDEDDKERTASRALAENCGSNSLQRQALSTEGG